MDEKSQIQGSQMEYNFSSAYTKLLNVKELSSNTRRYKMVIYKLIVDIQKELKLLHNFIEILEERLEEVDDVDSIDVINKYIEDTEEKIEVFEKKLTFNKRAYKKCNEDLEYIEIEIKHFERVVNKHRPSF